MKLIIVIMTVFLMQVSASTSAQKITLKGDELSLKEVFREIKKQTGFLVVYKSNLINGRKPISLNLVNVPLEEALSVALKNQNLEFSVKYNSVMIKEKTEPSFLEKVSAYFANIDIHGRVVDSNGNPIPGATVSVKGSNKAVITENNGSFSLANVDEKATLVISYIGYQTLEVAARADLGIVKLEVSNNPLDEVQVIAYGTTSRRLSSGNVVSVKAKQIENQPVNNPLLALKGLVPGLMITQASGNANANVTVRVQGQNSIAQGNDPFYVIDGVPYLSQNLPGLSSTVGAGSPLAFINPASIESIEVLKDADATAIYGSRAANGAILITTKKGKAGATNVSVNVQQGWANVNRFAEVMNTEEFLAMRKEAFFNNDKLTEKSQEYVTAYDINGTWDQNRYTNWQKELIGGTARYQDYQTNLSGGNNYTNFLFGANYHRETTVFPGDFADRKASMQLNLNHSSANNKFKFQFTGNYLDDDNRLPSEDLTLNANVLSPNAPALYNEDGSLNWAELPNGNSTWTNPLSYTLLHYHNKTTNLIANSVIGYELLKGLTIKSSFGFNRLQSEEFTKTPMSYANPEYRAFFERYTRNATRNSFNWIVEPQLTYQRQLWRGKFELLAGSSFQNLDHKAWTVFASGYVNDSQMDNILTATTIRINDPVKSEYKYQAVFGRVNYNINDKYIFNFNIRRDGTSRFGSKDMFHAFYSLGGAWVFSDETFIKNKVPFLSFGKLRASYGTTGSDQVGDYSFMNVYTPTQGISVPYQGAAGFSPIGHANPYLRWEQTQKSNVGLDLGFFKNRLLLNANYFRNITSDQLVTTGLSPVTGFSTIKQNIPAKVLNAGLELILDAQIINSGKLKWSMTANTTFAKNKLLEFPGLSTNTSYRNNYIVGQSLQIFRGYKYAGVNAETGLYQFVKADGTLSSSPSNVTDRTVMIDRFPKHLMGLQNSFSYGGLEFGFLLQYVDRKIGNYFYASFLGAMDNQPKLQTERWKQVGDVAKYQKVSTNSLLSNSFFLASDYAVADAGYLRLANVSLSWRIPTKYTQNVNIYANAQNLLTISSMRLDPEVSSTTALPPLRVITIGTKIGF